MVSHGNQILLIPFERASTQGRKKGEISDIRPLENLERENEERGDSKNKRPVKAEKHPAEEEEGNILQKKSPLVPPSRQPPSEGGNLHHLWRIWFGGSISTKVGLFFAATLPPEFISGNPAWLRSCEETRYSMILSASATHLSNISLPSTAEYQSTHCKHLHAWRPATVDFHPRV